MTEAEQAKLNTAPTLEMPVNIPVNTSLNDDFLKPPKSYTLNYGAFQDNRVTGGIHEVSFPLIKLLLSFVKIQRESWDPEYSYRTCIKHHPNKGK